MSTTNTSLPPREQHRATNAALRVDFPPVSNDKTRRGRSLPRSCWKCPGKILTDRDDENKFHHVDALVAMPASPYETGEPPCLERTIGLVVIISSTDRTTATMDLDRRSSMSQRARTTDVDAHRLRRSYIL